MSKQAYEIECLTAGVTIQAYVSDNGIYTSSEFMKELNKMFGMTASDIDKYSRVIFPVTFTSFQLMYWIIYQHLSDDVMEDLVYLHAE